MKLLNFAGSLLRLDVITAGGVKQVELYVEDALHRANGVSGYTVEGDFCKYDFADEDQCDDTISGLTVITDPDIIKDFKTENLINFQSRIMADLACEVASKFNLLVSLTPESHQTLLQQLCEVVNDIVDNFETK